MTGPGHALSGVRVQRVQKVQKVQRVVVAADAADYKKAGPRPRHFDRSEAEWRNLLPLMVRAALEREIFRLRVSSERFPSALHTDTQPRSR